MPSTRLSRQEFFADPELPLAVVRRGSQEPYPRHTHDFTELVIVLGGQGTHFTDHAEYPVMAGDVFIIQGDLAHGYRDPEHLELVNLMFDLSELDISAKDLGALPGYHALFTLEPQYRQQHHFASRLRLLPKALGHISGLVDQLECELVGQKPGFQYLAKAYFMQVIGELSRSYAHNPAPTSQALLRIGQALSYLEEHLAEPVNIASLTAIAHMSESSLLRAFKRATGLAPMDYLLRLRIRKACRLLQVGDPAISQVAAATGFCDSNYFARQFRKVMSVSPREFRNRGGEMREMTHEAECHHSCQVS
jgi:AraC-like DNA-binding protein